MLPLLPNLEHKQISALIAGTCTTDLGELKKAHALLWSMQSQKSLLITQQLLNQASTERSQMTTLHVYQVDLRVPDQPAGVPIKGWDADPGLLHISA